MLVGVLLNTAGCTEEDGDDKEQTSEQSSEDEQGNPYYSLHSEELTYEVTA